MPKWSSTFQGLKGDEFTGDNENVPAVELANILLLDYQTFNRELKTEIEQKFR